jgi:catalase
VDNFFAETEQVAFCTNNIVPGVDFSNDPLLQGRNFSYLDTQVKRLGGPNFTHIPINAPKCPFHNFQQDGHMAMMNPKGRVNYEPNSWGGAKGGPRESHETGFRSFSAEEHGRKLRERSETFADHYSQARQFYLSQTKPEQGHIADALIFELSKVERAAIRIRVVSHLPNIDPKLADRVAKGLGLREKIQPANPAKKPLAELRPSKALSIVQNGPRSFAGRKVGILVTDGTDRGLFDALKSEVEREGATVEVIAPVVGGVRASDGSLIEAQQKIGGGPSVLYDAVAVIPSEEGCQSLLKNAAARDFVSDAFTHLKFVGYVDAAMRLFEKAGVAAEMDDGFISLAQGKGPAAFVAACRKLRKWEREQLVTA